MSGGQKWRIVRPDGAYYEVDPEDITLEQLVRKMPRNWADGPGIEEPCGMNITAHIPHPFIPPGTPFPNNPTYHAAAKPADEPREREQP